MEYKRTRFLVCILNRIRRYFWCFHRHSLHQENLWSRYRIQTDKFLLSPCQQVCIHFDTHMSFWLKSKQSDNWMHRPNILCNLKENSHILRVSRINYQDNQTQIHNYHIFQCFPKHTDTHNECKWAYRNKKGTFMWLFYSSNMRENRNEQRNSHHTSYK